MQKFYSREARFSDRVLQAYAGAGLPEIFVIRAASSNAPAEILLYDEIGGFGVSAKKFVQALVQAGDGPVTVRINSPGGDPFEGMAIYNALKGHTSPVKVVVDGLAASAASFIAMAGDEIEMHDASMLMIHCGSAFTYGNAEELTGTIAVLQKIDANMADIYAARTGKPAADMMALMKAETWLTSSEAVAEGFATGIVAAPEAEQADRAAFASAERAKRIVAALRAALPDYDPDGDGDNDAAEALTLIQAAMDMLDKAADALTGEDDDAESGEADAPATDSLIIAANDNELNASAAADNAEVQAANDNSEREKRLRRLRLAQAEAA